MSAYRHHFRSLIQRPQQAGVTTIYQVTDRLHRARAVRVPASEIAATVTAGLAELDAQSPLVEDLARAVSNENWPATHSISEHLAVEVAVAA